MIDTDKLRQISTKYNLWSDERQELYKAIETIEQTNIEWIPCSERLPEEKENSITRDYYTYECTFTSGNITDIRYFTFGGGHWWHGCGCMDGYVTAWRERPEPYKEVSE